MKDVEAATQRLKSTEESHKRNTAEQESRSNHLQERLMETRARMEEVGPYLR